MTEVADLEERRLEAALRRGERAAAEELVRRTYRRTYAALLRWTRCREEAEDLTQETYRLAWRRLASFRGEARFSSWIHRIAYHAFLNSRRNRDRQRPLEDGEADTLVAPGAGPAIRALVVEEDTLLRSAVDRLPEPFRGTLLAFYWEEIPVVALAEEEGITTVAVRKRLAKARRLLRDDLASRSGGPAERSS